MKTWKYNGKWINFYFGWDFDISFEICGYFDNRPRLNFNLIFFSLQFILPFRNNWTDECIPPKWGVSFHDNILWIHTGGKGNLNGGRTFKTIYMPWKYKWVRTSYLRKDGEWEDSTPKLRKEFWEKNMSNYCFVHSKRISFIEGGY